MIRRSRAPERFLATILFTDIVGSTDLAARLGDREWRRVVAAHHAAVRKQLKRFGGREIDTAGDGFFASFDQPAQAVRGAEAIVAEVAAIGLTVRAGVHTGEAEAVGRKIGGIAVHIAARVMAIAGGGQVLVSQTVHDLVAGAGLDFSDAGTHELKGVPGEWRLYALSSAPTPVASAGGGAASAVPSEEAPRWRRLLVPVAAVAALAAAAIAVAVIAGGLGRATPTPKPLQLAAGPDTLVTLDRSGETTSVTRLESGPVALAIDGENLWVAALDRGVLSQLNLSDGSTLRTLGRVGRPTGLSVGGGLVWVADAFGQTVTVVDGSTGDVRGTTDARLARQITYGFDSLWATDDIADRVIRFDPQSGDVAAMTDLTPGAYPAGIATGLDAVWVANPGTNTLARINPLQMSIAEGGIALRAVPDLVAVSSTDVWVTSRADDLILRVDPGSNSVSATVNVGDGPVSIVADGDTVWVGCAGTRDVWHIARDGTVLGKTNVGGVPAALALSGDRVFVAVHRP